jgi:signal transduction histidine kinase
MPGLLFSNAFLKVACIASVAGSCYHTAMSTTVDPAANGLEAIQTRPLTCPHCRTPIAADTVVCPSCGADIELMTLAADRALFEAMLVSHDRTTPISPEHLAPRLGAYLVRHKYVTADQLQSALVDQAKDRTGEGRRLIGQTLVRLGFLTSRDLDQAIASQLLELQTALLDANRGLEQRVHERTAELEAALTRLTEFNQLKANFVANVSHELRTPLTHIKGYNSLLTDETLGPTTPDQREALRVTAASIGRLEQLINDLIAYAAAARGELTVNRRFVSLAAVASQVIERLQPKAVKQHITLSVELPGTLPLVSADEEKLSWLLLQLVDNGLKFTPQAGQVTVSAAVRGELVLIAVRDTGIGIPEDRLDDIFEPFRQLDGSTTRRYGGTGLGLALVRQIVEAHGSEITVDSQVGQGSTFSFALPCRVPD